MAFNWNDLLNAIALVLIIEGILPFASPPALKNTYRKILGLPERTLRMIGAGSIVLGLLLLFFH